MQEKIKRIPKYFFDRIDKKDFISVTNIADKGQGTLIIKYKYKVYANKN